jgi:NADH-quinone oxidoreductase subunit H
MTAGDWIELLVKSIVVLLVFITGFAYLTLFERRVLAQLQNRVGPNRVGPGGILQPAADGVKLLFKEDIIPDKADKFLFVLAPIVVVLTALLALAVVPFGPSIELFGRTIPLYIADINIGVLFFLGVGSLSVYGVVLAGWASNNKYALLGGLRASSQMISYELAMGLSVLGVVMLSGSMSMVDIVNAQQGRWFIFLQPLGFLIFVITMVAELKRAPFDLPEAEQELVAGFHTEYSGMKFAMFYMGEYISMIVMSAVAATLYLGGWRAPIAALDIPALGPVWLFAKVMVFLFVLVWLRASFPRLRYDRLMGVGWKILLPLALLNLVITAVAVVGSDLGWFRFLP